MTFANPAGLFLLALAIPIVLLHVLKPKRQEVEVSSTFLWQSVAQPVSAAAPWQKLRFSWLLLLQLLAVLLLAVAVAQPVRTTAAPLARHTVFIIDASGSMASVDGKPDRLADAVREAKSLRKQLPAGGIASVVVASPQPSVVLSASPDPAAFDKALNGIRTTAAEPDFATAFTLASSLETPAAPVGFVLLSDGGLPDEAARLIPEGTRYEQIGSRAANRAIRNISVSPRGAGLHVRLTLRNEGGDAATETVRVDVDGKTAATRKVRLGERETVEQDFDVVVGDRIEAFLEGEDLLASDNHAFAVAARRRPVKVLLAGPEDPFLTTLLGAMAGVTVERTDASRPAPDHDLAIYNRVAVPADPGAPWLAIKPPGGVPGTPVAGDVERPAVTLVEADDTLTQGLDLSEVVVASAQKVAPAGDEVVVGSDATALIVRGTRQGRPFAYLTFALADSNLPLHVAFPILGDRLISLLTAQSVPLGDVRVGDTLPVAGTAAAVVETPLRQRVSVPVGGVAPHADRPGFWTVREEGKPDRVIAVNADAAESNVAPKSVPVQARAVGPGERAPHGEVPLTRWVVVLLLMVLAAELLLSRRYRGVPRRQWRAAMVLRAAIALLLVGVLVDLRVPRMRDRVATMFLIDASDSMGGARTEAVDWVKDALGERRGSDVAGVAFFGGDARIETSVQRDADLVQQSVKVDASRTNLAGGLRLAAAVLPADARRRIVVVSDGRATEGDAAAVAQQLRRDGIRVDVHAVARRSGLDAAITRLDAPSRVRRGDTLSVRATVVSNEDVASRVTLSRDGVPLEERDVALTTGENVVDFSVAAGDPGTTRFQVTVSATGDTVRENNTAFTATHVQGVAKVLVVEGSSGVADPLEAALKAGGMEIESVAASSLPALDKLAAYEATVLVDVDAASLAPEQVSALTAATRDLGHGLVAVGGDRSYALGGYLDSDLEKLLPVVSEIKDPKRRASVAEVLAIDTSGSMAACHCRGGGVGPDGFPSGPGGMTDGGVNKTDISRTAAARTIAALNKSDQVGVLAFSTQQKFVIPLGPVPSKEDVDKGLAGLHPEGGTDLTKPLLEAGRALKEAKAKLKHIILFTDGFTSHGGLQDLVNQARDLAAQGITVSVLGTGEGASEELRAVAEAGRGRFYPGRDLNEIPRIMVQEAVLASRNFVNEGEFFPKVTSNDAVVRGLTSSPALLGYVATTAKPSASTQLVVGEDEDPLLATWQIGLGRATSWTSDLAARWSQRWATWDGYVDFWSSVVKGVLPSGSGVAGVRAVVDGDRMRVFVESETPFEDGAVAEARVFAPDGSVSVVRLDRTGESVFVGEVSAASPGAYAVGVALSGARTTATLSGIAIQSYSPEYRPGSSDAALLERVSRLSGGRGVIGAGDAFDKAGLVRGRGRIALAGWLLLLAALAWPVDVALRRLALHGAPVVRRAVRRLSLRRWLRRKVPSIGGDERAVGGVDEPVAPAPVERPPEPVPASLARLLERKRGTAEREE